jgi:hypothetical protein
MEELEMSSSECNIQGPEQSWRWCKRRTIGEKGITSKVNSPRPHRPLLLPTPIGELLYRFLANRKVAKACGNFQD